MEANRVQGNVSEESKSADQLKARLNNNLPY